VPELEYVIAVTIAAIIFHGNYELGITNYELGIVNYELNQPTRTYSILHSYIAVILYFTAFFFTHFCTSSKSICAEKCEVNPYIIIYIIYLLY